MIWQCPLCKSGFESTVAGFRCEQGHEFDRAREGYVNLLPVQHKNSKAPGDTKDMLRSRREFLEKGYYAPLVDTLAELLAEPVAQAPSSFHLLDSGCGEGYYLGCLRSKLGLPAAFGLDIAKDAARLTAKRDKSLSVVVASGYNLPVADASIDAILRIFAPGDAQEYARVLKPDGHFIVVSPGPQHLQELRALVMPDARDHEAPAHEPGFVCEQTRSVTFTQVYDQQALQQMLAMTPIFWRASIEGKAALGACTETSITADFLVRVYRLPAAAEQ